MARATSLSFSPEDNATFALACWDGKIALFLPASAVEADQSPPNSRLSEFRKDNIEISSDGGGGSKGASGRRAWKQLWREVAAATSPSKKRGGNGGGNGGGNLEDQDGAFLCWCKGPAGSDAPAAAGLAVTAYSVRTGDCPRQRCEEDCRSGRCASFKDGTMPTPPATGEQSSLEPFPPAVETGPGFELFAGGGLGERLGGAVSGSRPAGLTPEPTAERYLIHGLAAGPNFVALYDSDLCLHVVSLAAILGAGRVLPPPLPPPRPCAVAEAFSAVRDAETSSAGDVGEEAAASLLVDRVTLASNDHGMVAACVRRYRGPEGDGVGSVAQSEDGLELLLTWRNATSGLETPDNGECVGRGSSGDGRRLPFLPGELGDDDGGGGGGNGGGVFDADVRWGRAALFTRYCVLVYTRPGTGEGAGSAQGVKSGDFTAARPAGGWSAFAEAPVVHGLLLGGMGPRAWAAHYFICTEQNMFLLTLLLCVLGRRDGTTNTCEMKS